MDDEKCKLQVDVYKLQVDIQHPLEWHCCLKVVWSDAALR
jgi:hypothetical protein